MEVNGLGQARPINRRKERDLLLYFFYISILLLLSIQSAREIINLIGVVSLQNGGRFKSRNPNLIAPMWAPLPVGTGDPP